MENYADAAPVQPAAGSPSSSKGAIWTSRIIGAIVVLFLIFDGVTKVLKVPQVVQASARLQPRAEFCMAL